ncbi:hypothetical protein HZC07_01350, partial [Candidatus Micrarchaeota archaeon]|nr:hypothetical protein [Candidatus Micrarchaeota archaeon]
ITLLAPAHNSVINTATAQADVDFSYRAVSEVSTTMTCSLKIDGTTVQTDSSVRNNTRVTWTRSVPAGQRSWSVDCVDANGNSAASSVRLFTISNPNSPLPPPQNQGSLLLTYTLSCSENVITAKANGAPLDAVHIFVQEPGNGSGIYEADTDRFGNIKFPGCGNRVDVSATRPGYTSARVQLDLVACGLCAGPQNNQSNNSQNGSQTNQTQQNNTNSSSRICVSDASCSSTQYCDLSILSCADLVPGCGKIENQKVIPFQCGDLAACTPCANGYLCDANKCVKETQTHGNDSGAQNNASANGSQTFFGLPLAIAGVDTGLVVGSALLIILILLAAVLFWFFKMKMPPKSSSGSVIQTPKPTSQEKPPAKTIEQKK